MGTDLSPDGKGGGKGGGGKGGKGGGKKKPKPIGTLSCYSKYLAGNKMTSGRKAGARSQGWTATLSCSNTKPDQLFGCSSMLNNPMLNNYNNPMDGNGYVRSGERFVGDWDGGNKQCQSFALKGDSLSLGIRCCHFDNIAKTVPSNVDIEQNRVSGGYGVFKHWYPNFEPN